MFAVYLVRSQESILCSEKQEQGSVQHTVCLCLSLPPSWAEAVSPRQLGNRPTTLSRLLVNSRVTGSYMAGRRALHSLARQLFSVKLKFWAIA